MIKGKNINFRFVETDDAEFILQIRTDEKKNKYLSSISFDIDKQIEWINEYKQRELKKNEFYFIIESQVREKLGLVRIYDLKKDSFCWGSWLIKEDAPNYTAIESALQIYEYGFYILGFKKSHFDVRKENERVNAFHQRFGAAIIDEDEQNNYYSFTKETYEKIKIKYKRYLK